ncbi:MAG: hypothetical protein KDA42_15400, partial [Planctomycetales bacterium]|nr:hypothetical protein [Planctomycetales bacterium]
MDNQPSISSDRATRFILLGASNVSLNLARIVSLLRQWRGANLEIFIAAGHGRSYGLASRVLGRELPAIRTCDLWTVIPQREAMPTYALITDIGNDIAFGATPNEITSWIETTIDHLGAIEARVAMTGLPMASLDRLGPWRYSLFRQVLFPGSQVRWRQALERAAMLQSKLDTLARDRHVFQIEQPGDWYGWDPIHVHRRHRTEAWT